MRTDEKRVKIQGVIDCMKDNDIIYAWNQRCEAYNIYDEYIYYMCEFDDLMSGVKPIDIVESLCDSFRTSDDYFCDGMYGLDSFDDIYTIVEDSELIEYIIDENDDVDNPEIREILDDEAKE